MDIGFTYGTGLAGVASSTVTLITVQLVSTCGSVQTGVAAALICIWNIVTHSIRNRQFFKFTYWSRPIYLNLFNILWMSHSSSFPFCIVSFCPLKLVFELFCSVISVFDMLCFYFICYSTPLYSILSVFFSALLSPAHPCAIFCFVSLCSVFVFCSVHYCFIMFCSVLFCFVSLWSVLFCSVLHRGLVD